MHSSLVVVTLRAYGAEADGLYGIPGPEAVAAASEDALRALGAGYRAPYLIETARAVCEGFPLDTLRDMPYEEAHARLTSLKGVGDKVADCVPLFGCGHAEAFPVDVAGGAASAQLVWATWFPPPVEPVGAPALWRAWGHFAAISVSCRPHRCGHTITGGNAMLGVWVNCAGVVLGGLLGTLLRGGIPKKYQTALNQVLALCVLVIGVSGAIETANVLIVIVSAVIGTLVGELLRIEHGLDKLGEWAQARFSRGEGGFAEGFVNATLLFSVGAMAVVGSLEAGWSGNSDTLLAKSVIDTVSAVIFASSFGIGVVFAAIPLTIYQGGIAALAGVLAPFPSPGCAYQRDV